MPLDAPVTTATLYQRAEGLTLLSTVDRLVLLISRPVATPTRRSGTVAFRDRTLGTLRAYQSALTLIGIICES
jgi:hypothetical protein